MCFIVDKKRPDKMISKRDIVCYKVLTGNFASVIQGFQYELGKLYKGLIGSPRYNGFYGEINVGFHSYSNKRRIPLPEKYCNTRILVKYIIPKGSMYYYNSSVHEYVSNQIIIKEVL